MIEYEGHAFNSHTGQSFSLSLCGSISSTRGIARIDTGKDGAKNMDRYWKRWLPCN